MILKLMALSINDNGQIQVINNKVSVPDHLQNKDATISISTDTATGIGGASEICGFKNNMPQTFMIGTTVDSEIVSDGAASMETGRVDFAHYVQHYNWVDPASTDPSIRNRIKGIPDFSSNTWTAEGVSYFKNAVLGASKPINYPYHGQEMYDISGGDFGYDFINDVSGASNCSEFLDFIQYQNQHFYNNFGFNTAIGAYSYIFKYSPNTWKETMLYLRTTHETGEARDAYTNYSRDNSLGNSDGEIGYDLFSSKIAYYFDSKDINIETYIADNLSKTLLNGGHFQLFGHVSANSNEKLNRVFGSLASDSFAKVSVREAIEHMIIRENYSVTATIVGSNVNIRVTLNKKYDFNETLLTGPISIKLDLSGTILQGQELNCYSCSNLFKTGEDLFLIEHEIKDYNDFSFKLFVTLTPNYDTLNKPSIVSIVKNSMIEVRTDMPVKIAVFKVVRGGNLYDASIFLRSNSLSNLHQLDIPVAEHGNDFWFGIISKEKQSILSDVQRFDLI